MRVTSQGRRTEEVLEGVELPDGSTCGGVLINGDGTLLLRLYAETDVPPGTEIELPGDRRATVRALPGSPEEHPVTDLEVTGPTQRGPEDPSSGNGRPQAYLSELAARCSELGCAPPVVRFLKVLGGLRTSDPMGLARDQARSLSTEQLATVMEHVAEAVRELRQDGEALDPLVEQLSSICQVLLEEMGRRGEDGGSADRPDPSGRVPSGRRRPEAERERPDRWEAAS